MKLPISIAEKLLLIQNGEKIPSSKMKHALVDSMLENGILKKQIQGRSRSCIYLIHKNKLDDYLQNHFGIGNLKDYINGVKRHDLSRAEAIAISSDSKLKSIRSFKGFLVNCYAPMECIFKEKKINLYPEDGIFTFISDYEYFYPPIEATIVGIENPENFRYIQEQQYLFKDIYPLFVSRYPQSGDLIKWLQIIPNKYLHFGDFDFAGLNIYINEYKKYLKDKAAYFLPPDIEKFLNEKGNRDNYNNQTILFDKNKIKEENVVTSLKIIEKYKKGLEQEYLRYNTLSNSDIADS